MLLVAAWAEMYGALSLETPAFVGVSVGRLYLAINLRRRDVPLSPCLRVQLQCSARVPKLGGGYRRRDEPQLQLEGWDGSGVSAAPACLTLLKMVPSTIPLLPLHNYLLLLFTMKTLGHQEGLPPSRQYVATT